MATSGVKLVTRFKDTSGDPWSHTFNYANKDATVSQINALMAGMITNKTIWLKTPATKVSAQIVETDVTDITIS